MLSTEEQMDGKIENAEKSIPKERERALLLIMNIHTPLMRPSFYITCISLDHCSQLILPDRPEHLLVHNIIDGADHIINADVIILYTARRKKPAYEARAINESLFCIPGTKLLILLTVVKGWSRPTPRPEMMPAKSVI